MGNRFGHYAFCEDKLQVPRSVKVLRESGNDPDSLVHGSVVSDQEIHWMMQHRPLEVTQESLVRDYGPSEAKLMMEAFEREKRSHLLGVLNWPGVATRWRIFLDWCNHLDDADDDDNDDKLFSTREAFSRFVNYLGRITVYRALALDDEGLDRIRQADNIFPSGQLKVSARELAGIVETHGVQKVMVARLYISQLMQLIGYDPSISLHDDWQTTTIIASGYATGSKRVHLFQLSVPAVEAVHWTLWDVSQMSTSVLSSSTFHDASFSNDANNDHNGTSSSWFNFVEMAAPKGVWLDGSDAQTERYCLYGVPFLSQRLMKLWVFEGGLNEMRQSVAPFIRHQHQKWQNRSIG